MNVSKKQLKEEVTRLAEVINLKVKRSFVFVEISCMYEGTRYTAFDFSKWATEDMRNVAKATRMYQAMLKENCGCFVCRRETRYLANFIEKYNWSEERGIAIATGRAVADIVRQIMGDKMADQTVQKSTSGFTAPELTHFDKVEKSNAGLSASELEFKPYLGKMLNATS